MPDAPPTGELDARFSSEGATATPWEEARDRFAGDKCDDRPLAGRSGAPPGPGRALRQTAAPPSAGRAAFDVTRQAREGVDGQDWRFDVRDGAFSHAAGTALVFEVAAAVAFAFGKGDVYSQTRWRLGG